jgi:hypothetical protein
VSYHSIPRLWDNGTDIVFVEKQSTVTLMSPYAERVGMSFIDSEGFGSEYGVALARICNIQSECAVDYTGFKKENDDDTVYYREPKHSGNLANITDCDVSGIGIGIKINGSTRLGLDLWTIDEINQANRGLEEDLDLDLQETIDTTNNSHYLGLLGILYNKGKFNKSLDDVQKSHYIQLLTRRFEVNGEEMSYIDWLKNYRIELDTVLAAAGPKAFWNWLKWKLKQVWPHRNYNRAMFFDSYLYTPTMHKFIEWYQKQSGEVIKDELGKKQKDL